MTEPTEATRESVRRLIDLIQVLAPTLRPAVALAIERCVLELVLDQMRLRITARLETLSAEHLVELDTLAARLAAEEQKP